jgi:hypothetical protein
MYKLYFHIYMGRRIVRLHVKYVLSNYIFENKIIH